jgi:hypothetical protein
MNTTAQGASAFAMDDPDMQYAELLTFTQVIHQKISDFTRLERVKIQLVRDCDPNWLVVYHADKTDFAISSHKASMSFGP